MAAAHSVDPVPLLEQHLAGASPDLLAEMVTSLANAMMSAQADQVCGAGYGERSGERVDRRNGYRSGTAYISVINRSSTSLLPSKKPSATTHLQDRHIDRALRGAHPPQLIPVAGTHLALAAAFIATPTAQEITLLTLQQLLHHQPDHRLNQRGNEV
jgi:hypothetical protein